MTGDKTEKEVSFDNVRVITLDDGYELSISYHEGFYDKVRKYFGLGSTDVPSDDQLKEFFVTCIKAV